MEPTCSAIPRRALSFEACPHDRVTHVRSAGARYYPYHYAPLVSDLAKHTGAIARLKAGGGRRDGGADSWAPPHGPVRPLVQLMSVLPPRRCATQLPRPVSAGARRQKPSCCCLLGGPATSLLRLLHVHSHGVQQNMQQYRVCGRCGCWLRLCMLVRHVQLHTRDLSLKAGCVRCSAAACLPRKLARLVLATQDAALGGASISCALADMFPRDMAPLVDMSGTRWAHTVRPLPMHGYPTSRACRMIPRDVAPLVDVSGKVLGAHGAPAHAVRSRDLSWT